MDINNLLVFSYLANWILLVVLYAAVFLLYRHFGGQLAERKKAQAQSDEMTGPKINETVALKLKTVDGVLYEMGSDSRRPNVIVFGSVGCGHCEKARPILEALAMEHKAVSVVVVYAGDSESTRHFAGGLTSDIVAVSDPDRELMGIWNVRGTPYFVATDSSGVIRKKGYGATKQHLQAFFEAAESAS
jgi:thiol-disulfide isomerase/thioredoxin